MDIKKIGEAEFNLRLQILKNLSSEIDKLCSLSDYEEVDATAINSLCKAYKTIAKYGTDK